MESKLKIGVLGAGHLGKIHLKCIKEIPEYVTIGFYDPDPRVAEEVSREFEVPAFDTLGDLVEKVDVVDIVTPTVEHFACASLALREGRHVFIEKPVVATPAEARELMKIALEARVKVQVGHVERFNPAFLAAFPYLNKPMFIEAHRLALFNPRGTDVPVVLDLMIHDIDIVLSLVKSNVKRIHASGVAVVSDTPDIANARIEFENGCVANLTASRISLKNMRKTRFFQRDAYISVDFLNKDVEVVALANYDPDNAGPFDMVLDLDNGKPPRKFEFNRPEVKPINAIQTELASFAQAILTDSDPPVTILDGLTALQVAWQIMDKIAF
ncbi:MAG: Gfo/Idh/MocA family protein [Bacteroidales bacterium]